MANEQVLIVDDDPAILRLLEKVMSSNQLIPHVCASGQEALDRILREAYSLILLDVNMKGMDGFRVLELIRQKGIATPVMIITARVEEYDTLYGLELGADDYITKPFNPVILGAKAKALIRRSRQAGEPAPTVVQAGPFTLDRSSLKCRKNGVEILLSSKEALMLLFFLEHAGQIYSKEQLYLQLWDSPMSDDNTIMVHINHLRSKIEDDPKSPRHIITVRGVGYKFVP